MDSENKSAAEVISSTEKITEVNASPKLSPEKISEVNASSKSAPEKMETELKASRKSAQEKMETELKASPKSSPTKKDIDIKTKALNFYTQGKRHLLVRDIPSAINSLQEACKLLAEEYGDLAIECAEPYFNYGKALLEMARIENGVLGNALDGVPDGEDLESSQVENPEALSEDQKADVSNKVGEALEENYVEMEKQINGKETIEKAEKSAAEESDDVSDNKVNGDLEHMEDDVLPSDGKESGSNESEESQDDDKSEEEDKTKEDENTEGDEPELEAAEPEEEGDKTDEDEDVSNLQLSWEVLELAKVIYQKQLADNDKLSLKLAQVHLKLGEVSLENENYAQSVEDITECIKIQKEKLKADDRCLAESHYQLGVAHSFSDEFEKSTECFKQAAKVIEDRIANLLVIKKEKDGWSVEQRRKAAEICEDPLYSEQGEIEELEKLLPDIKEKIVDMEEMKKDSKEKLAKVKDAAFASLLAGSNGQSSDSGASTSTATNAFSPSTMEGPAKAVSNISHLVKKKGLEKRKPEEDMNGHEAKKSKLDSNGVKSTSEEIEKMEVTEA